MSFTFVDAGASDDRDNRRKIRKHLSIFHSLQRRQRDVQKQKHAAELRHQSVVAAGPLAWRLKNDDDEETTGPAEDQNINAIRHSRIYLGNIKSLLARDAVTMPDAPFVCSSVSPSSVLSAARNDPFSTYPIPRDAELDATVDFFVNGLGPYLFAYARNDSVDLFRFRGFVIASQDPAAFHTNMLLASINLDLINGRSLPGIRALRHRIEAIRLINERIAKPTKVLDESTIYAIIILACLQQVWGAVGRGEIHGGGLQQVLIKCGGLRMLRNHPLLEHVLYGIALVTPHILSFGAPYLYTGEPSHLPIENERRALSAELLELLDSMESRAHSWPISMLSFAFQHGSPLHELLVSPVQSFIPDAPEHSLEASERSRLSVLFHFHCILMRLPDHAEVIKWARKLNNLIRDVWIWRNSLTMVQYMIVKVDDAAGLEDSDLAWQVLRLVEISSLLLKDTYINMKDYMLAMLSQSGSIPKLDLWSIQRDLGC